MVNLLLVGCTVAALVGSVLTVPAERRVRKYDDDHLHLAELRRSERSAKYSAEEKDAHYWVNDAQQKLVGHLKTALNTNKARNVIMFLGDGMSIPTLGAARAYQGQLNGKTGEEEYLSFEKFPFTGLSKTFCVNYQVADSACTATAYLCGVKANYGTIGVTGNVDRGVCETMRNESNQVTSLLNWAQEAGKATGIVTTARVTHASPAGAYAHIADRNWESDAGVVSSNQDPDLCDDIAEQLVNGRTGKNFKVILGGGRREFIPSDVTDEEGTRGRRTDGKNLIDAWLKQKRSGGNQGQYVWNRDELRAVDYDKTDYLLGLFEGSHMLYHLEDGAENEPTLAELTESAIKILQKEKKGFALFVEGARIDHGHHATQAKRALDETVEMAKAVEKALELTSTEDTLIVVTSDHAHVMTYNGYPERGNDILGIADTSDVDGLPYATISYANGPGYKNAVGDDGRHDISNDDMSSYTYEFPAMVPLTSETHGGDDVGVFASGPWAHLFSGVYDQNYIPHAMAYAACVGHGLTACSNDSEK